jgi:hypothetical protein
VKNLLRDIKKQLEVVLEGKNFRNLELFMCGLFRGNTDWEEKKLKGYAKR